MEINNIDKTVTGAEFKQLYPNTEFYKILTKDLIHNNYTYVNGVNIDPIQECSQSKGGLYFTELNNIGIWLNEYLVYIVKVNILDDSLIYIEKNQFKANKFSIDLDKKWEIKDFPYWNDYEFCKLVVQQNICALKYVLKYTNISHDERLILCKEIIKKNCMALQHITNEYQTEEICKLAVQQSGFEILHVKNEYQTEEMCKLAVSKDCYALKCIKDEYQTEEICKIAVSKDGFVLYYVSNKLKNNKEICKLAVQNNGYAFKYVPDLLKSNKEICKLAVQQNCLLLKYIKDNCKTEEMCKLAVKQVGMLLGYVPDKLKTKEICKLAVSNDAFALYYVPNVLKTEEIINLAVQTGINQKCRGKFSIKVDTNILKLNNLII